MAKAKTTATKKPSKTAKSKEPEKPQQVFGRARRDPPFRQVAAASEPEDDATDEQDESGPQSREDDAERERIAAEKAKRDRAELNQLAAAAERQRAEDAAKAAIEAREKAEKDRLAAEAEQEQKRAAADKATAAAEAERKAIENAASAAKIALTATDDDWLGVAKAQEQLRAYADNTGKPASDRLRRREEERAQFLQDVKPIGLNLVRRIMNGGFTQSDATTADLARVHKELSNGILFGRFPIGYGEIGAVARALEALIGGQPKNMGTHPTILAGTPPTVAPVVAPAVPPVASGPTQWERIKKEHGSPLFIALTCIVIFIGAVVVMAWYSERMLGFWNSATVVQPSSTPSTSTSSTPTARLASTSSSACVPLRDMPGAQCDETPGHAGDVNCALRVRSFELREEIANAQLAVPNVNTPRVFCPAGVYMRVNGSSDPVASGTYDYHDCTSCPPGATPLP